jgi:hypothetical protein
MVSPEFNATRIAPLLLLLLPTTVFGETIAYRLSALRGGTPVILAEGTRTYSPDADVEVEHTDTRDGAGFWSKRILLAKGFKLEANVYRERQVDGFGLVVTSRPNMEEFSWNWFDRETGSTFTKRRGSGRLRVKLRTVEGLVELESIEFLDDVALTYQDRTLTTQVDERTHELLIKKGSVFRMAR